LVFLDHILALLILLALYLIETVNFALLRLQLPLLGFLRFQSHNVFLRRVLAGSFRISFFHNFLEVHLTTVQFVFGDLPNPLIRILLDQHSAYFCVVACEELIFVPFALLLGRRVVRVFLPQNATLVVRPMLNQRL
jgi:hypothetical protein